MSAFNPPDPFFNGIDYNRNFFSLQSNFITLTYATKTFLNKITGGVISGLLSIIYSTTSPQLLIRNTNASSTSTLQIQNDASTRNLTMGVGNSGSSTYPHQSFIQTDISTSLALNAGGFSATPELFLSDTGNVGVRTNNPLNILQVGNAGRLRIANDTTDFTMLGTADVDGSTNTRIVLNGNTRSGGIAGDIDYRTTSTGDHTFYTGNTTERMRILDTGNIGIGTNNPTSGYLLDVRGNLAINTNSANGILITNSTANSFASLQLKNDLNKTIYFGLGNSTYGSAIYGTNAFIETPSSTNLILNAGATSTPTMTLTNTDVSITKQLTVNGNVGINTSTNSTYALDVYNPSSALNACRIQNGAGNGYLVLSGGASGLLGYITFFNGSGTQTGYIGWGGNLTNYFDFVSQGGYLGYRVNNNLIIGSQLGVGNGTSSAISGTNALTITGTSYLNGNVGIGSSSPQTILDVNGTISVRRTGTTSPPVAGINGGGGDRLILLPASSASTFPHSIGVDALGVYISGPVNSSHAFYINGFIAMTIGSSTSSLKSRLDIDSSQLTAVSITGASGNLLTGYSGEGLLYWGNIAGATVTNQNFTGGIQVSLKATGAIIGSTYVSTSDKRIKKNFKPIENISTVINGLKPVQYDLIKTDRTTSGFIAQEVAEVYPSATSMTKDFIPNIMEKATVDGNIITFQNSKDIVLSVGNAIKMCKEDDYNNGDGVIITGIIDNNHFTILDEDAKLFTDGYVYLYGVAVADFMNVDYNEITTLNTKAIQDLYLIIAKQQEQINLLLSMR
jgi:hypothetical protein